jgi:hypothetical protein
LAGLLEKKSKETGIHESIPIDSEALREMQGRQAQGQIVHHLRESET